MLISREAYREQIEGKTDQELLKEIRGLKRRIGMKKKQMEHPDYEMPHTYPEPDMEVDMMYEYLEEAIAAAGESYSLSALDRKAEKIADALPGLKELIFSIGGFCSGTSTCLLSFKGDICYKRESDELLGYIGNVGELVAEWPAEDVIAELQGLHLGRWKSHYAASDYGIDVLDGTQWKLALKFTDGTRPLIVTGDNAYPYNFNRLLEVLLMEEE